MNWLWESPWTIVSVVALLEVALAVALLRTGRALLLAAIAGVAVLGGVLLFVERMILTDREQVEATLDDLSATLVTNDVPAVLRFIAPSATEVRALAERTLPEVKVNEARVGGDLEIKVDERAIPQTAEASFTGVFSVALRRGTLPHDKIVRRFRVKFVKQQDRWLIAGVEESDVGRH